MRRSERIRGLVLGAAVLCCPIACGRTSLLTADQTNGSDPTGGTSGLGGVIAAGADSGGIASMAGAIAAGGAGIGADGGFGPGGRCPPDRRRCASVCVDVQNDSEHCGGCKRQCVAGEICVSGSCEPRCAAGLSDCGDECVDPLTDETHCGAGANCELEPGVECGADHGCQSGVCVLECAADRAACDDACIDPETDADHCGAGADCAIDPGQSCGLGELCRNAACFTPCVFDTSLFPIYIHAGGYYYGDLAFDDQCRLLVAGADQGGVFRVDASGAVSALGGSYSSASSINGVVYRPSDGLIYVGTNGSGRIHTLDGNGTVKFVVELGETVNALALAPAGFGAFGNQILAASLGHLYAIDPAGPTATAVITAGILTDVVVAADGSVYAANYTTNTIALVQADGSSSAIASGFDGLDGLTVDPSSSRLFAANCWAQPTHVDRITLPGGSVAPAGDIPLNAGYYTSGMVMDDAGTLLVLTTNGTATVIDYLTP